MQEFEDDALAAMTFSERQKALKARGAVASASPSASQVLYKIVCMSAM
jgi:hypothetical protein